MVLIVWGHKVFVSRKGTIKTKHCCQYCNLESHWRRLNIWKWFTLFFIPIVPYQIDKLVVCPVCGSSIKLTRENKQTISKQIDKTRK